MGEELTSMLQQKVSSCPAEVGIALRGVDFDLRVDIHSHQVFRSASIIKVPLLVTLYWLAEQGQLRWEERLPLRDADRTPGSGILRELQEGLQPTLYDLAVLMIVLSDNTATNMLIDRIGVEPVQQLARLLGFEHTTLQRRMYDFAAAEQGKENLCCAAEIADLLWQMARGEVRARDGSRLVSSTGCERMIHILREQFYRDQIPALLPAEAKVANKTGEISAHHHDAAIVWTPAGCYTLVVLTRGFEHRRQAAAFIADLSWTVYQAVCRRQEQDSS